MGVAGHITCAHPVLPIDHHTRTLTSQAYIPAQVERAWSSGGFFTRFEITPTTTPSTTPASSHMAFAPADSPASGHQLVLWFVNADIVTKVGVMLPVEDLLHADLAVPRVRVAIQSLSTDANGLREQAELLRGMLAGIPKGYDYIARVCYVLGEVIQPPAQQQQQSGQQGEHGTEGVDAGGGAESNGQAVGTAGVVGGQGRQGNGVGPQALCLTTPARVYSNPLYTVPAT